MKNNSKKVILFTFIVYGIIYGLSTVKAFAMAEPHYLYSECCQSNNKPGGQCTANNTGNCSNAESCG